MRPDLQSITQAVPSPVTRFAPSPTGYLHLGHVVNAIYVWGVARAVGGRVVLRIEDHDRLRSRPAFETALLEDLRWLGFEPDQGLQPLQRQSETLARYALALDRLRATHHVYACACSRREIGGERYSGRCRSRGLPDAPRHGIRVQLDRTPERFHDLLLGDGVQAPAEQCGDLLIKDRDGQWTYQFAVTVDDIVDGVNLVIRGADLLSSTGRQLKLARMLGRAGPPLLLHHPLILKAGGDKLSKASGDTGVRDLRRGGMRADEVVGQAAARIGLLDEPRPFPARDLADLFR